MYIKKIIIFSTTILFILNLSGCGHKKQHNRHKNLTNIKQQPKSTFSSFKKETPRGFVVERN